MATIDVLIASEIISSLDVELEHDALPCRRLLATPGFIQWLEIGLPELETTVIGGDLSPLEQVDFIFHEYISGEDMNYDRRFKRLHSTPDDRHVWEIKTPDIRIFGWVPKKDTFICCFGDMKDRIELMRSYPRYIAQTVFVRTNIALDEPKCIATKEYNDVISTKN